MRLPTGGYRVEGADAARRRDRPSARTDGLPSAGALDALRGLWAGVVR